MGLPFKSRQAKRRDQIVAIDLGGRTSKAVHLQRRGDKLTLSAYALLDAPIFEKALSADVLAEHLKAINRTLGNTRVKQVTLALGVNDTLFRQVELPLMATTDLRLMLKFNSKNYLQQDLPDHVFDCYYLPSSSAIKSTDAVKPNSGAQKQKVMVGGAKKQTIDELQEAIKSAGLIADQIVPGIIGPTNAFEMAEPVMFAKEVVALVDIGFKNSTITILNSGEIILNRVVAIGGDRLTGGLAEAMNISYVEAENIKVGMPAEVQQNLEPLINPLGRELRASIDFFEHQQDRAVGQVFVSGGSARSKFIVEALQAEMMIPCQRWNPLAPLQIGLPEAQAAESEQFAPQLAAAVERVANHGAELLKIDVIDAVADLLVAGETNANRSVLDFRMSEQVFRRFHNYCNTGLVIGA
jgi:type IV pilus assembly protein PilM